MYIKFGDTRLLTNVLLAPMAGITDFPFRKVVREIGDFLVFSEMVASQAVIRQVKKTHKMIEGIYDEYTVVQIVGADPVVMAEAAKICVDFGAKFLDINMGCPVKKIIRSEAGSALMKQEQLAAKIMQSVVQAVSVPVSLKIRLGWDLEQKNAVKIAMIAEDAGIKMISIHGRTRNQLYSGQANWCEIRAVKEIVNIPVIVNGDIINVETAKKALAASAADGIMIGRGAIGAPWVLMEIHNALEYQESSKISRQQKIDIIKKHIAYMLDFYPKETAIKLCRKVLISYCKNFPNASQYRANIIKLDDSVGIEKLMEHVCEKKSS